MIVKLRKKKAAIPKRRKNSNLAALRKRLAEEACLDDMNHNEAIKAIHLQQRGKK